MPEDITFKESSFEDLNTPDSYDTIRSSESYRTSAGELVRSVSIIPRDENDPQEERARLVIFGRHRIGFDPRTHKAWIRDGVVNIAPLPR